MKGSFDNDFSNFILSDQFMNDDTTNKEGVNFLNNSDISHPYGSDDKIVIPNSGNLFDNDMINSITLLC